jgi:hypothetical protein
MNERILELADKAAEGISGDLNIPDEFCEKFAELIVRDCMLICEDVMKKDNSALGCWSEIKRTFRS